MASDLHDPAVASLTPLLLNVMRRTGRFDDMPGWSTEPESTGELHAAVRSIACEAYGESPSLALQVTLRKAFRRTRHAPIPGAPGHTFDEIGKRLLGLEPRRYPRLWDDETDRDRRLKEYDKVIRECLSDVFNHVTKDIRDEVTAAYRRLIASSIVDMARAAGCGSSDDDESPPQVVRPYLAAELSRLIVTSRCVTVWGASGDGKTTIVRQVVASVFPSADVVYVDFASSYEDVDSIYVRHQLRTVMDDRSAPVSDDILWSFKNFLALPDACDLVVLDDLSDALAQELLPNISVDSIAISRRPIQSEFGPDFHVPEMSDAEAFDLARARLPDEAEELLRRPCGRLGNRPLPISVACSIIDQNTNSADVLLEAIDENSADAFDAMQRDLRRPSDRAVTAVYRVLLEGLYESDIVGWEQLCAIAWVCGSADEDRLHQVLVALGRKVNTYRFGSGLEELRRGSLIVRDGPRFSINLLTLDMVRWLTRDAGEDALERLAPIVGSAIFRARLLLDGKSSVEEEFAYSTQVADINPFLATLHTDVLSSAVYMRNFSSRLQGVARLGTSTWLYWTVAPADDDGEGETLAAALVTLEYEPQVRFWTRGLPGHIMGDDDRVPMLSLIRTWIYAEHDWFAKVHLAMHADGNHLLSRRAPFEQPSFVILRGNKTRHLLVLPYGASPMLATAPGGIAWSACGWLVPLTSDEWEGRMEGPDQLVDCPMCLKMGDNEWTMHRRAFLDLVNLWDGTLSPLSVAMFAHFSELQQGWARYDERLAWVKSLAMVSNQVVLAYALAACRWLHTVSLSMSEGTWPPDDVDVIEAQTLKVLETHLSADDSGTAASLAWATFTSYAEDYQDVARLHGRAEAPKRALVWRELANQFPGMWLGSIAEPDSEPHL